MIHTIDKKVILIDDKGRGTIAGDQQWFKKFSHSISGCGPTTAALVLMYMASVFPDRCRAVYPYELPARKDDFVTFMGAVREYVKPGLQGLTDAGFFASSTVEFAKSKGVNITATSVSSGYSVGVAYGYVKKAVDEGYLPALLILRNPAKELDEFTWHWMAITGYDDDKKTIFIATNGTEHELLFEKVWQQQRPYHSACVYFYPE
jgi:hypothetical protein